MFDAGNGIYRKYSSSMVERRAFFFSRSIYAFIVCDDNEKMFFFWQHVIAVPNMFSSVTDDLNCISGPVPLYLNHRIVFFWQSISRDNEKRLFCGHKAFFY